MTGTRWARWAAGAGVLFVVLFAVSFFITNTPNAGASPTKIANYYLHHKKQVNISGLLIYLAVFVGAWFYTWLFRYYRSFRGLEAPAVVSLIGAVIFAVSGALSAGINFAFTDHTKELNDGALVALNNLQSDLTYPMTTVGLAIFYAATVVIIRKGRAFPQWLAWVSGILVLVMLIPPVAFFGFLATPVWILIVSVLLWRMPAGAIESPNTQPEAAAG